MSNPAPISHAAASAAATKLPLRFVTAASLFDGHDAAINIMRRIIQSQGVEVIHLGHNRSVEDVVRAALQEDADAIAISSYQGGHIEYFKYMVDMLKERGASHIRIFGGGGGTITPEEVQELENYGVERLYRPDDGMHMGLAHMIEDVIERAHKRRELPHKPAKTSPDDEISIGCMLTAIEADVLGEAELTRLRKQWDLAGKKVPIVGVTGTGGAGKSSVIDELILRFLHAFPEMRIAVLAVDPTRRRTGGALLGDRIRLNSLRSHRVFMRSMATRRAHVSTSAMLKDAIHFLRGQGYDLVLVETAGIGQSDSEIVDLADFSTYVMTSDYGAASQLEKIDMLDYAELVIINKYDRRGSEDAVRDVRKQWKRNRVAFKLNDDQVPVYPTIASQFNDPGVTWMFVNLCRLLCEKLHLPADQWTPEVDTTIKEPRATVLIPGKRVRYLAEISEQGRGINQDIERQAETAALAQHYYEVLKELGDSKLPQQFGLYESSALLPSSSGKGPGGESSSSSVTSARPSGMTEVPETQERFPGEAGIQSKSIGGTRTHLDLDSRFCGNDENKGTESAESAARTDSSQAATAAQPSAATETSSVTPATAGVQSKSDSPSESSLLILRQRYNEAVKELSGEALQLLRDWPAREQGITAPQHSYLVRGKPVKGENYVESLSHEKIPKLAPPNYTGWGDLLRFLMKENLPGGYPYTAGVYPYRRTGEDPTRMFAGEGTPEATNRRFHYLAHGQPASRLSTAFDSVTLYGEDPAERPDIYGKIGNSGVSIATLDDMKKLYSGFDLCDPKTSVSMTINGPAPMILAMFMNTAIDQQVEKYLKEDPARWAAAEKKIASIYKNQPRPQYTGKLPEGSDGLGLALLGVTSEQLVDAETYARIKADALHRVRGTVQADILKEDQAQNTCIFSTEFALRMMGDIQQYFVDHKVRNFYSVSISGYHIAEAGANPISQLAFTLSNGFTIVEYYLARGMSVDDFAPNLSFFFSNGMDPEYSVIGRVARRIWARAMRERYGANERSQMLKYHIQTSGRSLHAQEIQFNDIRTTLQALYAIFDNCNSLHTNAYDEALTTPTEESVRRAVAIQLIINHELGLNFNENPWQGSFIIERLTDMVEEAVYKEFEAISERGGVLGAMDTMYQRGKIQEESLYYEQKKHDGSLPIIGVNTFLPKEHAGEVATKIKLIRSNETEKHQQIANVQAFRKARNPLAPSGETSHGHATDSADAPVPQVHDGHGLRYLQDTARERKNIFEALMQAVKTHSLGQISHALYDVGGEYRRNM